MYTKLVLLVLVAGVTISSPVMLPPGLDGRSSSPTDPNSFIYAYFDGVAQVTTASRDILLRKAQGYTNYAHKVPMTFDAQFPVASNTKLYTAISMYQLQEKGILNVTEDIANYLDADDFAKMGHPGVQRFCPTLINSTECQTITIKNLLSMSSGLYGTLRCSPRFPAYMEYCNPAPYVIFPGNNAAMVGTFIMNGLEFAPGTNYSYSNPNFILSTYLIEKFSNMSYNDYITQHIIEPLKMSKTYFDYYNNQFEMNANRIGEYFTFVDNQSGDVLMRGEKTVDFDLGSLAGTGGVISTVEDEEKLYRDVFNFQNGSTLLSKASQLAIVAPLTPMVPPALVPTFYTQGVIIACNAGDITCAQGPIAVFYQGGTMVVHTVNILDLRPQTNFLMTQVYASSLIFNTTLDVINAARATPAGNFYSVVLPWQSELQAVTRAWTIHDWFAPPI